jgi:hypothetical protein
VKVGIAHVRSSARVVWLSSSSSVCLWLRSIGSGSERALVQAVIASRALALAVHGHAFQLYEVSSGESGGEVLDSSCAVVGPGCLAQLLLLGVSVAALNWFGERKTVIASRALALAVHGHAFQLYEVSSGESGGEMKRSDLRAGRHQPL